jgi:hypothetical protein
VSLAELIASEDCEAVAAPLGVCAASDSVRSCPAATVARAFDVVIDPRVRNQFAVTDPLRWPSTIAYCVV